MPISNNVCDDANNNNNDDDPIHVQLISHSQIDDLIEQYLSYHLNQSSIEVTKILYNHPTNLTVKDGKSSSSSPSPTTTTSLVDITKSKVFQEQVQNITQSIQYTKVCDYFQTTPYHYQINPIPKKLSTQDESITVCKSTTTGVKSFSLFDFMDNMKKQSTTNPATTTTTSDNSTFQPFSLLPSSYHKLTTTTNIATIQDIISLYNDITARVSCIQNNNIHHDQSDSNLNITNSKENNTVDQTITSSQHDINDTTTTHTNNNQPLSWNDFIQTCESIHDITDLLDNFDITEDLLQKFATIFHQLLNISIQEFIATTFHPTTNNDTNDYSNDDTICNKEKKYNEFQSLLIRLHHKWIKSCLAICNTPTLDVCLDSFSLCMKLFQNLIYFLNNRVRNNGPGKSQSIVKNEYYTPTTTTTTTTTTSFEIIYDTVSILHEAISKLLFIIQKTSCTNNPFMMILPPEQKNQLRKLLQMCFHSIYSQSDLFLIWIFFLEKSWVSTLDATSASSSSSMITMWNQYVCFCTKQYPCMDDYTILDDSQYIVKFVRSVLNDSLSYQEDDTRMSWYYKKCMHMNCIKFQIQQTNDTTLQQQSNNDDDDDALILFRHLLKDSIWVHTLSILKTLIVNIPISKFPYRQMYSPTDSNGRSDDANHINDEVVVIYPINNCEYLTYQQQISHTKNSNKHPLGTNGASHSFLTPSSDDIIKLMKPFHHVLELSLSLNHSQKVKPSILHICEQALKYILCTCMNQCNVWMDVVFTHFISKILESIDSCLNQCISIDTATTTTTTAGCILLENESVITFYRIVKEIFNIIDWNELLLLLDDSVDLHHTVHDCLEQFWNSTESLFELASCRRRRRLEKEETCDIINDRYQDCMDTMLDVCLILCKQSNLVLNYSRQMMWEKVEKMMYL